ncbi:Transcriptional regulator, LysR family protein [Shewanella benthica]|uniref:Transcriptional regulator, LysR family protein n=1 Tax=Shewanella benthica TaxID=43661 RepID=A0A330M7E3_9GAMM|nr:LysR family transcriptional regulator [Shewanella benthica]SQH78068.1 Transcriptional regulator, LysR family protein [Shewanella benthica]
MKNLNLDTLDLLSINILVSLHEHHSATLVAKKMNISAPKISRCLQHSRVIFNNPLFIRKKHGFIPNEFAKQLYPIAKEIVQCSEHLYQIHVDDSGLISVSNHEYLKQIDNLVDVVALKRLSHLDLVCDLHHPLLKQEITLESIAQYPYVSILGKPEQATSDPFLLYCSQHQLAYHLKNEDLINHNFNIEALKQHITDTGQLTVQPYI